MGLVFEVSVRYHGYAIKISRRKLNMAVDFRQQRIIANVPCEDLLFSRLSLGFPVIERVLFLLIQVNF